MNDYQRVQSLPGWAESIVPFSPAFQKAILFCLAHENEYHADGTVKTEHDPNDPGGTTKYGIDKAAHPNLDIENLTLEQAVASYHADEWMRAHGDALPEKLAICHFDGVVNMGEQPSAKMLQSAVLAMPDGSVGPATLAAAQSADADAPNRMLDAREQYYRHLRQFPRYGKGWLARVSDLLAFLSA